MFTAEAGARDVFLYDPRHEYDCAEDGVVLPRKEVEILPVLGRLRLPGPAPPPVLRVLQYAALVGNGLYVVLVRMAGGEQCIFLLDVLHPPAALGAALNLGRVVKPFHLGAQSL